MIRLVVTGTDTGVGKTVLAAAIAAATGVPYWKPIQSGLVDGEDAETAAALGAPRIVPSAYRFSAPLSPHRAAELDGVTIDGHLLRASDRETSRHDIARLASLYTARPE